MARGPRHSNTKTNSSNLQRSQQVIAAAWRERLTACDDDDDEDWDDCDAAPDSGPAWDPLELDDDEPQPEYGDFWDDSDELED